MKNTTHKKLDMIKNGLNYVFSGQAQTVKHVWETHAYG